MEKTAHLREAAQTTGTAIGDLCQAKAGKSNPEEKKNREKGKR